MLINRLFFRSQLVSIEVNQTKNKKIQQLIKITFLEWDRFYRVSCDVSMDKMQQEGSVVVTTIFEAGETNSTVLDVATPPPITAQLSFLDINDAPLGKTTIGDQIQMIVTSAEAGPHNMMVTGLKNSSVYV